MLTNVASPTIAKSLSVSKRTSILLISIILFDSILFFYCCFSNKVFLTIEPPNATWWQRCSRLTRSKSIPRQRRSPSALGSSGAILLTAKLYLSTARRRSSLSPLRKAEVLLLHCGTAKPYLSTLRQLLYYTERWQQSRSYSTRTISI